METTPHRWVRGVLPNAGLWAALSVAPAVEGTLAREAGAVAAGMAVVLAVVVAVRRSLPGVALALVVTAALLQLAANVSGATPVHLLTCWIPVAVLSYRAGRWDGRARPAVSVFGVAIVATLPLLVALGLAFGDVGDAVRGLPNWSATTVALLLSGVGPWLFGRYWRQRNELITAGWTIAERLEREREIDLERARLRERARIATEMHDSLGHELALIAVRAAALEMASGATGDRDATASELRAATHAATLRLREIIGVLRTDDTEETPEPEDVATLVERTARAGVAVRLAGDAEGPDPATSVGRAVHRVVQEALTNAAKHAPSASVSVRIGREAGATTVAVESTAPTRPAAPSQGADAGVGLSGLRALVDGMGGAFDAGPRDNGFAVWTRLPDGHDDHEGATVASPAAQRVRVAARSRRRLVTAIAVPLVLATAVASVGYLLYGYVTYNSVLPASRYAELDVGDRQSTVEEALPWFETRVEPADEPPVTRGSACQYYLDNVWGGDPLYRLCFADGRLVAKDAIRA